MEDADIRKFRFIRVYKTHVEPTWRRFEETASQREEEGTPFSFFELLEVFNWLCLGVELDYFEFKDTEKALNWYAPLISNKLSLPIDDRIRIILFPMVANCIKCDHDLIKIKFNKNSPEHQLKLQVLFKNALRVKMAGLNEPLVSTFFSRLSLAEDSSWDLDLHLEKSFSVNRITAFFSTLDTHLKHAFNLLPVVSPLLDGLIKAANYFELLAEWASSVSQASEDILLRDEDFSSQNSCLLPSPAFADLVSSVGMIQRWRLDLRTKKVEQRLADTTDLLENALKILSAQENLNIDKSFSHEIPIMVQEAINNWRKITTPDSDWPGPISDTGGWGGGLPPVEGTGRSEPA